MSVRGRNREVVSDLDARLAALRARRSGVSEDPIIAARGASTAAPPPGAASVSVLGAPTGPPVDLSPPTGLRIDRVEDRREQFADNHALVGRDRTGRRAFPARRARIGVTAAAAAGFVALVPIMGPLTAAEADGETDPVDGQPAIDDSVPEGTTDSTIELTSTTSTTLVRVDSTLADAATTIPASEAEPTTETGPSVAVAPSVGPTDPARPTPKPSAAPAPAAPTPARPPAPAPAAPTPTAAPAPLPTAAPTTTPPPPTTVAAPPPTAPPPTAPPPTTPPPTTAPPPPTTSPS